MPAATRTYRLSDQGRRALSDRMKRRHADPKFRAANRARRKRMNADPKFKAAARVRMQRLNADPELTARRNAAASGRMKRLHADPKFRSGTPRAHEAAQRRSEVQGGAPARA